MPKYDIEEIGLGRFIVRDARANPLLKGEGELAGNRFTLTSHRRGGLLARLRERGFRVRAAEDRIAALPRLPEPLPLGQDAAVRLGSSADRVSWFDPRALRWIALAPSRDGAAEYVTVPQGAAVRRRRSRGQADYYLARPEGAGVWLTGVSHNQALLAGYAQAAADRPVLVARLVGGEALLPDLELPEPHHEALRQIGREERGALLVAEAGWPFAQEVFERLGLELASEV